MPRNRHVFRTRPDTPSAEVFLNIKDSGCDAYLRRALPQPRPRPGDGGLGPPVRPPLPPRSAEAGRRWPSCQPSCSRRGGTLSAVPPAVRNLQFPIVGNRFERGTTPGFRHLSFGARKPSVLASRRLSLTRARLSGLANLPELGGRCAFHAAHPF